MQSLVPDNNPDQIDDTTIPDTNRTFHALVCTVFAERAKDVLPSVVH